MRSINKVILVGNLTRNPEMRQTPNGQNVTTFGVATNRDWMTKTGDKKNSAEFHECVAWARLAEICEQYLTKGHLVYVEGYLKTRSWDSPEGVKKFKTEIVVKDMIRLEKRSTNEDKEEDYIPEESMEELNFSESETPATAEASKPTELPVEAPAEETPVKVAQTEESSTKESPIDKDLGL